MRKMFHALYSKGLLIAILSLCALVTFGSTPALGYTTQDIRDIRRLRPFYDKTDVNTCAAPTVGNTITVAQSTEQIAKTIIGVAKTYNLGQRGALIGLMTGITESGLQNYANRKIPLSTQNPAWLALPTPRPLGQDGYSVGVFQQQVNKDWNTAGPVGDPALNSKEAVYQLMDVAYSAQAFYGSPPGSDAPRQLKKGLQNLEGWEAMDPAMAAQRVQISAYPDGSNYRKHQDRAQALLTKYWDSSPPVALSVPVNGGTPAEGVDLGGDVTIGCVDGGGNASSVNCSLSAGQQAGNLSEVRKKVVCLAEQELKLWNDGTLKRGSGYRKYSQGRGENWCADFVSWIYNQAGYPVSTTAKDGNEPRVAGIKEIGQRNQRFHFHAVPGYIPKPGDIAIQDIGGSHVNIVVAVSGNKITVIGGNQGGDGNQGAYYTTSAVTKYTKSSPQANGTSGYVTPD